MIRMVDTACRGCKTEHLDVLLDDAAILLPCLACGGEIEQIWWRRTPKDAQWDDATAVLIHVNSQTGEVSYPGRTDAQPRAGFESHRLRSLREVENFERAHNVRSEMAWFDQGSGRGHDDYVGSQKLTH